MCQIWSIWTLHIYTSTTFKYMNVLYKSVFCAARAFANIKIYVWSALTRILYIYSYTHMMIWWREKKIQFFLWFLCHWIFFSIWRACKRNFVPTKLLRHKFFYNQYKWVQNSWFMYIYVYMNNAYILFYIYLHRMWIYYNLWTGAARCYVLLCTTHVYTYIQTNK